MAKAVLSLQSQVVYGHVGNSAAMLALQMQGFEVMAVPTAILAHHPGPGPSGGPPAGRVLAASEIAALVGGVVARGQLRDCPALLSGWLGSAANGAVAVETAARLKAVNPKAIWLCDPVLGDRPAGLYVPEDLADYVRAVALPAADIVTPNHFELEWLTGRLIATLDDALAACAAILGRGPVAVFCTSLRRKDAAAPGIETLAVSRDGAWLAATPEFARAPHGAGDLFAAVLLARWLRGQKVKKALTFAVAATYGVLRASNAANSPELELVAARNEMARPTFNPTVVRVR